MMSLNPLCWEHYRRRSRVYFEDKRRRNCEVDHRFESLLNSAVLLIANYEAS